MMLPGVQYPKIQFLTWLMGDSHPMATRPQHKQLWVSKALYSDWWLSSHLCASIFLFQFLHSVSHLLFYYNAIYLDKQSACTIGSHRLPFSQIQISGCNILSFGIFQANNNTIPQKRCRCTLNWGTRVYRSLLFSHWDKDKGYYISIRTSLLPTH